MMRWLSSSAHVPPSRLRQVMWTLLGVALMASGILMAIMPLIMGAAQVFIGLFIVLRFSRDGRKLFVRVKRNFPDLFRAFDRWRHRRNR